jgi:predicted NUDIX family phosphoesterase
MDKDDEQTLVVTSDVIFKQGAWQGLKTDNLDYYLDLIKNNYQFKRRGDVENDSSFQQIIPYILFNFKNKYFLYKYLGKAGEKRLVGTHQLGIGGHINPIDGNSNKNILDVGMMREWEEEADYKGNLINKKLIGIINDDSRPVERVHLGLVYNFTGDSPEIFVRETDKMQGELVELKNIGKYIKGNKDIWAQIIYKEYLSEIKDV